MTRIQSNLSHARDDEYGNRNDGSVEKQEHWEDMMGACLYDANAAMGSGTKSNVNGNSIHENHTGESILSPLGDNRIRPVEHGWNNNTSIDLIITDDKCSDTDYVSSDDNDLSIPLPIGFGAHSLERNAPTPDGLQRLSDETFQEERDHQQVQKLDDLPIDLYALGSLREKMNVESNHHSIVPMDVSGSVSDSGDPTTISISSMRSDLSPIPMNSYQDYSCARRLEQNKTGMDLRRREDIKEDRKETKSVDQLLAYELNQLTFQERESINEEIHGIRVRNTTIEETPELLDHCFRQLDIELTKKRSESVIFDRVQRLFGNSTYFNTKEFRIMFLRSDFFDCDKAANRICRFADLMYEIHGDYALQRRPKLSDFTDLELEVLELGGYQILPGRDRAGRRIVINLAYDNPEGFGFLSRLRVGAYVLMSMLDDIETQRKGIVAISWWCNINVDDFIIRGKVHNRMHYIPMRVGAMHCCIPSQIKSNRFGKKAKTSGDFASRMSKIINAMLVFSIGSNVRPRFRLHTGSVIECVYALQSFGIHSDQLPVNTSSEKWKMKEHLKWLELCRLREESLKNKGNKCDSIIECPNQTDILFGRGRPIMRHPGNAILRYVVQSKLEEYTNAKNKKETTDVTWSVVRILKGKYGARFLKEETVETNGLAWVEVSNETARQKVRIAFRDLRSRISKTMTAETDPETINETKSENAKTNLKGNLLPPPSTKTSAKPSLMSCFFQDDDLDKGLDGASKLSTTFNERKRPFSAIICLDRNDCSSSD